VRPSLRRAWRWFDRVPELAPLVPSLAPRWYAWLATRGDAYGADETATGGLLD
jgi:hypothetical protein